MVVLMLSGGTLEREGEEEASLIYCINYLLYIYLKRRAQTMFGHVWQQRVL